MDFTVLMSVYFKESPDFLHDSLTSVLIDQTLPPTEVVIVKDGILSEDLERVLGEFASQFNKIRIVGYKMNRGLGRALQYGLDFCTNELVFRMDTDDICVQHRFEKQLSCFENEQLDICGGNIEEFENIPGDLNRYRKVPSNPSIVDFESKNPFNHMTVAFKKSSVTAVGGYEDIPGYEDYFLWLKLMKDKAIMVNMDEVLVYARTGNGLLERRRGKSFFRKEVQFQRAALKLGVWDISVFCRNFLKRAVPRLFPTFILGLIYKLFLRR